MGQTLRAEMQQILTDFMPVLQSWTIGDMHRMIDQYETVYDENYSTSNAAVIYSSIYRNTGSPDALLGAHQMIDRSVQLLNDRTVDPFCRVFLYHYSMMALLLLPERSRSKLNEQYSSFYASYEDDCGQGNTNCAALQWAMEAYVDKLGYRAADQSYMTQLLDFIEGAQNAEGFINDGVNPVRSEDVMPIAYHAFSVFILTSALAILGDTRHSWSSLIKRAELIVKKGRRWIVNAIAQDGSLAMTSRSSHQVFTWGTMVAYLSCSGDIADPLMRKALHYWLPYKHEDGTYSCTPNHFSHSLRIGFEDYTHVNMYNNLALTGIAIGDYILETEFVIDDDKMSFPIAAINHYIDEHSGFAFYRNHNIFFGCELRMHARLNTPAMQGFHYRTGDRKLPIPEPRLHQRQSNYSIGEYELTNGVWEGFLLLDKDINWHYPSWNTNVDAVFTEKGLKMSFDSETVQGSKWIEVTDSVIEWRYELTLKKNMKSCEHVIPILISDGQSHSQFIQDKQRNKIFVQFQGNHYVLHCAEAKAINLQKHRSFISVSGVSAQIRMAIGTELEAGQTIVWSSTLALE